MARERARRWFRDATGGKRTVLTAVLRPTEEEHARIEEVARRLGLTVDQLLSRALKDGIAQAIAEARAAGIDV